MFWQRNSCFCCGGDAIDKVKIAMIIVDDRVLLVAVVLLLLLVTSIEIDKVSQTSKGSIETSLLGIGKHFERDQKKSLLGNKKFPHALPSQPSLTTTALRG